MFLLDELRAHVGPRQPNDLVFAGIRNGAPLRVSTFRLQFGVASAADVKVVQQMLGHSSATMTLDTYGHLFDDRLDEVGDAMDRARRARPTAPQRPGRVAPCCPSPIRREIPKGPLPALLLVRTPSSELYPRRDSNPRYRLERAAC